MPRNVTGPILCVVGARPNFMKIAPVLKAMTASSLAARLVHTGQHYDGAMNGEHFQALDIPDPDVNLGVGSGTHAVQTAEIMRRFEPVLDRDRPSAVLVVGDVNSTIACALVAVKKGVPVVHVEAGLRSNDRSMPEEINRVLTDQLSELLFTTERSALENLRREGVDPLKVHFVGNVMIDTLRQHLQRAVSPATTLRRHGAPAVAPQAGYALLTLHRPSNVDDAATLETLLRAVRDVSRRVPVVFPVHPRTAAAIERNGYGAMLGTGRVTLLPALGYLEMLGLMRAAVLVLTDSGGIQEETTGLGVPCLTLRENTERPVTVEEGTNTVVGTDYAPIVAAAEEVLRTGGKKGRIPELWDGAAAYRIVSVLDAWAGRRAERRVA